MIKLAYHQLIHDLLYYNRQQLRNAGLAISRYNKDMKIK